MSSPIETLHQLGQSIWYDNIERKLLADGTLAALVELGEIRGITSNPSIFRHAIANSHDYDFSLGTMAWAGASAGQIFDQLAQEDIRAAADLFLPLYEHTHGGDGYVSLEISPSLAHDTQGTITEAQRLWKLVDRPNLMIKIPATREGLPAIRYSIASGLNINITLIFSLRRYLEVMIAYLSGLEDRLIQGDPVTKIASVASFFVSRIDTKVDKQLNDILIKDKSKAKIITPLLGKAAIANARLAYQRFQGVFSSQRFKMLKVQGARLQRPLWASTSTKNPAYPDTMYVDELIGPDTINTMPPATLDAFRDHGTAQLSLGAKTDESQLIFDQLAELGISFEQVTNDLEVEGVKAFADAFSDVITTIEQRRLTAQRELNGLAQPVSHRVDEMQMQDLAKRIHAHEPGIWTSDKAVEGEIQKRQGWLDLPASSQSMLPELEAFRCELLKSGYTHVLLLGMDGSPITANVVCSVFGEPEPGQGLDLRILASTDPAQIRSTANVSTIARTLYIVSSKSRSSDEIKVLLDYFWDRANKKVKERANEHFVAITDPGTPLEMLAKERGFRHVFLADQSVGRRFTALSAYGLVPAALLGINIIELLDRASWMAGLCAAEVPINLSPGLVLGAILGEAPLMGKDKLTILTDPELDSMGAWIEQLFAGSVEGRGIVPVSGDPLSQPDQYGKDRLFVYFRWSGKYDSQVDALRKAGAPAIILPVTQNNDLGSEFFRWEMAFAVSCAILARNPFD